MSNWTSQNLDRDGLNCRLELIAGWRRKKIECLELSIFKLRWGW